MGDRRLAWFISGFVAALATAALSTAARAQEQRAQDQRASDSMASRPGQSTYSPGPSTLSRARPSADQTDEGYAAPGIPPAVPTDDNSEALPEEADGLEPVPRAGQRAVLQDGDLSYPQDPTQPRDGVVDVGEPLPAEDGTDPSTVDTREPDDLAAFESPPAGHDPLLFNIEDLDPIRDNRATTRLFKREPFDPVGIRVGSFVMFPELELGSSWYSNVLRSPKAQSDVALDFKPSVRVASDWTTHALEFRAVAPLSYFNEFNTENDKGFLVETRGKLDITRRTNIQGLLSYEENLESRSALDASSAGNRVKQTVERAEASLNHRFNRLSVQIRGSVADYSYGDSTILGVTTANDDRDYTQYEETVRGSWELKPTLSVFTEVAVNQREHDVAARGDLINRSSDGQRYRTGVSFGNTGQILRGEVSLGYGVQTPDDRRLKEIDGLIIDANATWRASEQTSVLFNARSDIGETTTADVGGSMFRSVGVDVRHQFRPYLIGTAGLSYATQSSQDGIIDEGELRATVGAEYFLNREAVLFGRYAHANFDAVGSGSDYSSDEIHFGMRLRR